MERCKAILPRSIVYTLPRMQKKWLTVCGLQSVSALSKRNPEIIERLFFDADRAPLFAETCRHLAKTRKTYRLVKSEELQKITDSAHHQGVAAVVEPFGPLPLKKLRLKRDTVLLHDVLNPHNVGAILRTAAFFGVGDIILSPKSWNAAMTSAAWRVAEGGFSYVRLFVYESVDEFFAFVKDAGIVALAAVKPQKMRVTTLDEAFRNKTNPAVFCLGNEEEGLSTHFIAGCRDRFCIPGSGLIESLNVSVAAALCLERIAGQARIVTRGGLE